MKTSDYQEAIKIKLIEGMSEFGTEMWSRPPETDLSDIVQKYHTKIIKIVDSELDRVREETVKMCREIVKGLCPITFTTNGQHGAQEQEILYRMQKHNAEIQDAIFALTQLAKNNK